MYRRTANYCSSWTQLLGVGSVIYFGVSRYCYDNKSATMISGPTVHTLQDPPGQANLRESEAAAGVDLPGDERLGIHLRDALTVVQDC